MGQSFKILVSVLRTHAGLQQRVLVYGEGDTVAMEYFSFSRNASFLGLKGAESA